MYRGGLPLDWFGCVVPRNLRRRVAQRWGYRIGCPIYLLEAVVPIVCFRLFGPSLRGQRLILFIDNSTALFALRKGRSRTSQPLNELCFSFWALARGLDMELSIAWVPTRFNVADDPSRRVAPVGFQMLSSEVDPDMWVRSLRPALG